MKNEIKKNFLPDSFFYSFLFTGLIFELQQILKSVINILR